MKKAVQFLSYAVMLAVFAGRMVNAAPDNVTVTAGFSSGTTTTVAANVAIATSGNVAIAPGANVTFTANQSITLSTGFSAAPGSVFTAVLGLNGGIDDQAPSAPLNLRVITVTTGSIYLAWDNATDNVGVTGYLLFRSDVLIRTLSGTTLQWVDQPLIPGTPYSYYVQAFDAAGKISARSNVVYPTTTAADLRDPDDDGLPNAVESVFGTNPSSKATTDNATLKLRVDRPSL